MQAQSMMAASRISAKRDVRSACDVRLGARDVCRQTLRAALPRTLHARKQMVCKAESKGEQAD
eukprot:8756882-Pyramimonas_sp.AAC.1